MIKLRVVGSSEDHAELILSNKPRGKRGTHKVEIDRKLLSVLQDAVYGRKELEKRAVAAQRALEPRSEPKIPPREIQRRLRAGLSPGQVARAADVDEDYVEQFFPPIVYERAGVVQDVQSLYQEKPRLGRSGLPLGEAVQANLASRRVLMTDEAFADAWTATRQDSQPWMILLTFPFRGRPRTARWRYDPRTRELEPANKLAADIGWVAAGTRRAAAPKRAEAEAAARRTLAKRKPARRKPAAKRKPARRKPAAKRKPARRKPAAKRKPARRKPAAKRKPARRKPAAKRKPARRKPAARRRPAPRRRRR